MAAKFVVVAAEKILLDEKKLVAIRLLSVPDVATSTLEVVIPRTDRLATTGLEDTSTPLVNDFQPLKPYPSKSVPVQRSVPKSVCAVVPIRTAPATSSVSWGVVVLIPTRPVPGVILNELVGASLKISTLRPDCAGGITVQLVVVGVHAGSSVSPGWYGKARTELAWPSMSKEPTILPSSNAPLNFPFSKCIPTSCQKTTYNELIYRNMIRSLKNSLLVGKGKRISHFNHFWEKYRWIALNI